MKYFLITSLFICACLNFSAVSCKKVSSQPPPKTPKVPANFCISAEEKALFELINEYRASQGLPTLTLSKSLSYVAKLHVKDMVKMKKLTHSWSDCNYDKKPDCMWKRPEKYTSYTSNGYEAAYYHSKAATAKEALEAWKKSPAHNSMLVNIGMWKPVEWKAMGVAIEGQYAATWTGEIDDPEGEAAVCK
jgi:uncharacterized protein YkwD